MPKKVYKKVVKKKAAKKKSKVICIACGDTGINSKGRDCIACLRRKKAI